MWLLLLLYVVDLIFCNITLSINLFQLYFVNQLCLEINGTSLDLTLKLKIFRRHEVQQLSDSDAKKRLQACMHLTQRMNADKIEEMLFSDEKMFTVQTPTNTQNDRVYARVLKNEMWHKWLKICRQFAVINWKIVHLCFGTIYIMMAQGTITHFGKFIVELNIFKLRYQILIYFNNWLIYAHAKSVHFSWPSL